MSRFSAFFTSAALMIAPQSTLSGSMPVTTGAAVTVGLGDADGDGDASGLAGAAPEPLASGPADAPSEPDGASAPLDTVTTAVTVRRVPVSEPQADTSSTPDTAAANTKSRRMSQP